MMPTPMPRLQPRGAAAAESATSPALANLACTGEVLRLMVEALPNVAAELVAAGVVAAAQVLCLASAHRH